MMVKQQRDPNKAVPVRELDYYVKDIARSFLLFFLMIGPVMYKTYILKQDDIFSEGENIISDTISDSSRPEDAYTTLLTKIKDN